MASTASCLLFLIPMPSPLLVLFILDLSFRSWARLGKKLDLSSKRPAPEDVRRAPAPLASYMAGLRIAIERYFNRVTRYFLCYKDIRLADYSTFGIPLYNTHENRCHSRLTQEAACRFGRENATEEPQLLARLPENSRRHPQAH